MFQCIRRIPKILFLMLFSGLLGQLAACSDQQYTSLYDQALKSQRWLAGWQPQSIDIDGIKVAYLDNQNVDAKETLVFVHGYTGDKDMWNRLAYYLPSDYRMIALDLMGHGKTDQAPDNRYLLMNQAKLVNKFMNELNIDKAHLVGSSMGGATSLLFSLHFPERINSLTLMNSAGVHSMEESEFEKAIESGRNPMAIKNLSDFENMMALIFHKAPWVPEGFKNVLTQRASERYQHFQYVLSEIIHSANIWRESGRIYGLMPNFNKPVLIVWGDDDRVLHPSSVAVFKEHLPQAQTHILKNTGHVPMLEKPDDTANILMEFLADI